jgi:hypothetical protein
MLYNKKRIQKGEQLMSLFMVKEVFEYAMDRRALSLGEAYFLLFCLCAISSHYNFFL